MNTKIQGGINFKIKTSTIQVSKGLWKPGQQSFLQGGSSLHIYSNSVTESTEL